MQHYAVILSDLRMHLPGEALLSTCGNSECPSQFPYVATIIMMYTKTVGRVSSADVHAA